MSDFEFMFTLFGLLLGLSLAEVLAGLARVIDLRLRPGSAMRIGWLTPLLAMFVILDLLSFWQAAWVGRDLVAVSGKSLLALTVFASAYYLAASLVFPRDAAPSERDFTDHFFRVRKTVIGVMMALLICQLAWYLSVPQLAARLAHPLVWALTIILAILMIIAMVARGKRWAELAMVALVGRYLIVYLL